MARYYDGHELVYQRLKREGHESWDQRPYDDFYMRPFLDEALAFLRPGVDAAGADALDIGCGTGPVTFALARAGYRAVGVDISVTAIEMARARDTSGLAHAPAFHVADVLKLEEGALAGPYDVIVDSHCLHCIIYDADRERALSILRHMLKPDGALVIETMTWQPAMHFDPPFLYADDGILWREYPEGNVEDLRAIDGRMHHPNRRILPADKLRAELLAAGFSFYLDRQSGPELPHEPASFQAIARRNG